MLGRNFQNKGKSGWTDKSSFVLEVPLRYLRPSTIYSVPYDRILEMAYWQKNVEKERERVRFGLTVGEFFYYYINCRCL